MSNLASVKVNYEDLLSMQLNVPTIVFRVTTYCSDQESRKSLEYVVEYFGQLLPYSKLHDTFSDGAHCVVMHHELEGGAPVSSDKLISSAWRPHPPPSQTSAPQLSR